MINFLIPLSLLLKENSNNFLNLFIIFFFFFKKRNLKETFFFTFYIFSTVVNNIKKFVSFLWMVVVEFMKIILISTLSQKKRNNFFFFLLFMNLFPTVIFLLLSFHELFSLFFPFKFMHWNVCLWTFKNLSKQETQNVWLPVRLKFQCKLTVNWKCLIFFRLQNSTWNRLLETWSTAQK